MTVSVVLLCLLLNACLFIYYFQKFLLVFIRLNKHIQREKVMFSSMQNQKPIYVNPAFKLQSDV